jgi:hypothetical protein
MTATATFSYDYEIVIRAGQEDTDMFIAPDGAVLATVIGIPVSTEWEPEVYDAALLDAGWRRSGPWTGNDVNATAPVTPAATAPGTRDEWLTALDAETAGQTAYDAYSVACASGVFGGLPLALARCGEERLTVVAECGWTARYEPGQGWV